jgi:Bifunctional DNA primase/polymerase, N-terminal
MPTTSNLVRAALSYPTRGLAVLPCHWPAPTNLPQFCSCGDLECSRRAEHPIGTLTPADATCDLGQLSRWWLAHPTANPALITDETRVGVLEFRHAGPPDEVLRFLNVDLADSGPVIAPRPNRLQFLVKPDHTSVDGFPLEIRGLDPGEVVLLPPSRRMDGERVRWIRRLVTTTRLPDLAPLLDTLSQLVLDLDAATT